MRSKKVVRAVCFVPDNQPELCELQKVKSPVKLENFTTSSSGTKQDLIITKYTKITPLTKDASIGRELFCKNIFQRFTALCISDVS